MRVLNLDPWILAIKTVTDNLRQWLLKYIYKPWNFFINWISYEILTFKREKNRTALAKGEVRVSEPWGSAEPPKTVVQS